MAASFFIPHYFNIYLRGKENDKGATQNSLLIPISTNALPINKQYREKLFELFPIIFGDSLGVRTQDPNIKSVVLYQLS